jgi:murein DD-endopeptidase MepM/ murein hydrolase activator NlpD
MVLPRWIAIALKLAVADGFDFPVGAPDGDGYYDAQPFGGASAHLGADWNGAGGGDSDLGDPVRAVADGRVLEAADHGGGWGNVVRVAHRIGDSDIVESLYAHLDRIDVRVGERVTRGQELGTIGTAHGHYRAHLHFELRDTLGRPLGGGYGAPDGQIDPTAFIRAHRASARSRRGAPESGD